MMNDPVYAVERAEQEFTPEQFAQTLQRLDGLVQEFENLPFPEVREKALEMLQAIDAIHREGLGRLLAYIHQQGQIDLVLRAAHDPIINTLLQLYDFLPQDE